MNIKHYISAALLAAVSLGLASCDGKNEPEYTPANAPADSQRVFFASSKISKIVTEEQTEVMVTINRPEEASAEELTVQILPSFTQAGDDQIFTVAPEVTFPAGLAFAEFPVKFDISAMTPNKEYAINLAIDDAHADVYGLTSCTLVLNNEQMTEWALLTGKSEEADGYGYYVIGAPFSSSGITVNPVRVYERHIPSDENQIEYILQSYIPALEAALDEKDFDASEVEHDDNIDDENWIDIWHFNSADGGKTINFPIQECVFLPGIYYAEASLLYPNSFKNSSKFDPETGVFSINVMCFDEEGPWNPAIWTINLAGYADTNVYTLDISDNGQVNIGNTDYSVIGFNFSNAINLVEYTIVQLDSESEGLSEEEVEEIAETIQDPEQDKYEVASLEESGNITLTFPSSGKFEIVAVGYNKAADGSYTAKLTSTCIFKFTTFNPYEGWTVIAKDVVWENNILKGCSGGQAPGETVKVNISKNDKFDNYYRIDNPMVDCQYVAAFDADLADFGSLEFVIDEDIVYFPYSMIGVSDSDGAWELASYSYFMLDNDVSIENIPAALFGTYKDGVISFPESTITNQGKVITNFLLFIGEDGYYCNMDFNLNMKGGSAAAPAKKAAKAFSGKLSRNFMKMAGAKKPVFPAHFKASFQTAKKQGKRIALDNFRRR